MSFLTYFLITTLSVAGNLGTVESDVESLESEVARAQNERDALILKSPKGKNDPAVQAKIDALEERKKELTRRLTEMNVRPKAKIKDPSELQIDADLMSTEPDKNDTDDSPRGHAPVASAPAEESPTRVAEPSKPETVLSGEGIQGEITYSKKKKKSGVLKKQPEGEVAPASPLPGAPGLSEIQYAPKKKKPGSK